MLVVFLFFEQGSEEIDALGQVFIQLVKISLTELTLSDV